MSAPNHPFEGVLLSRQELAKRLKLEPNTVDGWCESRRYNIPKSVMKWGRTTLWSKVEIETWLEGLVAEALQ